MFNLFYPMDLVAEYISSYLTKTPIPYTVLQFEAETERFVYTDKLVKIPDADLMRFVEEFHEITGIRPLIQEYGSIDRRGIIFYFSFKEIHPDLDIDNARELV